MLFFLCRALHVHPNGFMPHTYYELAENVDELIEICLAEYLKLGRRLSAMDRNLIQNGWWKNEGNKISCILDQKAELTTLDFTGFDWISVDDPFDIDTTLELKAHGRTARVESLKDELSSGAGLGFTFPDPDAMWELPGRTKKEKARSASNKAQPFVDAALSQADVNTALGVTKSGVTASLAARLKRARDS